VSWWLRGGRLPFGKPIALVSWVAWIAPLCGFLCPCYGVVDVAFHVGARL